MNKPQVSTNIGLATIATALLDIFRNVKPEEVLSIFNNMTIGEISTTIMPLTLGLWAILHKEKDSF